MKIFNIKVSVIFLILIFIGSKSVLAIDISTDPRPGVKIGLADLVSPSQAAVFYGASSNHTQTFDAHGVSVSSDAPLEIVELASALGANELSSADYQEAAYEYIYRNIDIEFRYGLSKGAIGALIDSSGTAFDQAALLVELLQQAGISANYELGTLNLSSEYFALWSGLGNVGSNTLPVTSDISAKAACHFLANGGIPAVINGQSRKACDYGGSQLTSVTISHIRVVTGARNYDPAFKFHHIYSSLDIANLLGCDSSCGQEVVVNAIPSSSKGFNSAINAHYVNNVNYNAVKSKLLNYSIFLENNITQIKNENSGTNSELIDILGGVKINQDNFEFGEYPSSDYSFTPNESAVWSSGIPDQYRTKIHFQFYDGYPARDYSNTPAGVVPDILGVNGLVTEKEIFADEVYGKLFEVRTLYDAYTVPNSFYETPSISFIGVSGSGKFQKLAIYENGSEFFPAILSIDHPYAAKKNANSITGSYMDRTIATFGGSVDPGRGAIALVGDNSGIPDNINYTSLKMTAVEHSMLLAMGRSTPSRYQHSLELVKVRQTLPFRREVSNRGGANTLWMAAQISPGHTAASEWLYDFNQLLKINDGVADAKTHHHISTVTVKSPRSGVTSGYQTRGLSFDIESSLSISMKSDVPEIARRAALKTTVLLMNILESSVLEAHFETWEGSSAASLFLRANDSGIKFYDANTNNINGILSTWSRISENIKDAYPVTLGMVPGKYGYIDVPNGGHISFTSYLAGYQNLPDTYERILKDQVLRHFSVPGESGVVLGQSYIPGVTIDGWNWKWLSVPFMSQTSDLDFVSYIYAGTKGASLPGPPEQAIESSNINKSFFENDFDVSSSSGGLSFTTPNELLVGSGEFPYSLSFQRSYSSLSDVSVNYQFVDSAQFSSPHGGSSIPLKREDSLGRLLHAGWRHNHDMTGRIKTDIGQALGTDSAVEAAAFIATALVINQLNLEEDNFSSYLSSIFVANWWSDHITHNAFSFQDGHNQSLFTKLPSGKFEPPVGVSTTLTYEGSYPTPRLFSNTVDYKYPLDTRFTLHHPDGSKLTLKDTLACNRLRTPPLGNYSSGCAHLNGWNAEKWAFPSGINVFYDYEVYFDTTMHNPNNLSEEELASSSPYRRTRLKSVRNSLGRKLNYEYFGNPDFGEEGIYSSVTDDFGRSIDFSSTTRRVNASEKYLVYDHKVNINDELTVNYKYTSSTEGLRSLRLKEIFVGDQAIPQTIIEYDNLGRVQMLNSRGATTRYKTSSMFGGGYHIKSSVIDGLGNKNKYIFNEKNQLVKSVEGLTEGAP